MAPRKRDARSRPLRSPLYPIDPDLILLGDVRSSPSPVRVEGKVFTPEIAIWVDASNGAPWNTAIGQAGARVQTLAEAMLMPVIATEFGLPAQALPVASPKSKLPARVLVFEESLAEQLSLRLVPFGVQVDVAPRSEMFDALFASLLEHLATRQKPRLELPDDAIAALCAASSRLWREKPWEYAYDNPPFEIRPPADVAPPLYASILGANRELFGVAFYSSLEDYRRTLALGEGMLEPGSAPSLSNVEAEATKIFGHRSFLISFDEKAEVFPEYVDQVVEHGWPKRTRVVPSFGAIGGEQQPGDLAADEAQWAALALEALVAFCKQHGEEIAEEAFPISSTVQVKQANRRVAVQVAVPPPDEAGADNAVATPTVYRFKVALSGRKSVWRRIEVRSDQTLEDLHDAIQDAFVWDDDHLYAFFLSGKAWDASSEYVRPHADREQGMPSARVRLDRLDLRPRQRILYIFDFGDEWRHDVIVERTDIQSDAGKYPRIVEERGDAPPQYPNQENEDANGEGDEV
jgi:hypothetical protein